MFFGRPQSSAASIEAPMSSVWMWQFQIPLAADHHDRVADAGPHPFEGGDGVVGRFQEVHDLVAKIADVVFIAVELGQRS